MAREIANKHLGPASDLTLWAPIKPGFIDAFESVTYETRLKIVAKALFNARASAREYHLLEPFSDAAARIQAIESFRFAIPDVQPRSVLLAVTFDRPWEPYMRLVWRPLGTFLDLFFCNCEGYKLAATSSFDDYIGWVRAHQVESEFFLATSDATAADIQYGGQVERLQRERHDNDILATEMVADQPEKVAERLRQLNPVDTTEIGVEALVVLYRLADYFTPGTEDGSVLLRAAQDLLKGWDTARLPPPLRQRFADQLNWFETPLKSNEGGKDPDFELDNVQGGIVTDFGPKDRAPNHGCLLLMRAGKPAQARAFLRALKGELASTTEPAADDHAVHRNLGLTRGGLESLEVPAAEIRNFPREFRDGMESRAGPIGDVRESHPRRWKLPKQNWPESETERPPVDLSEVDFVIQLRTWRESYRGWDVLQGHPADGPHPLRGEVARLEALASRYGVVLLSVQSMRRADDLNLGREHFGFVDGVSQPQIKTNPLDFHPDAVARGEILCGYGNDRGDAAPAQPNPYLKDGSFLVVRRMRQDVEAFRRFVQDQAMAAHISADELMGKMMGRRQDGTPLVPLKSEEPNDFDFGQDAGGVHCPLQAHIRRTNPRGPADGKRVPRVMRRGMSYGPPMGAASGDERGTFFMAYGASIAEQFEVLQRWINGGNSSGVASSQSDPIMGAGQAGQERVFRFRHNGGVARVRIPRPFATVQWGLYLFTPSFSAIDLMTEEPAALSDGELERGRGIIAELRAIKPDQAQARAWKRCIEDFMSKDPAERDDAAAVWAVIRADHGGALRVPYGEIADVDGKPKTATLVAKRELVMRVLTEDTIYSMRGKNLGKEGLDERMGQSFGHIFLGMDAADGHEAASQGPAAVAMAVSDQQAFVVARQVCRKLLHGMFDRFEQATQKRGGKIDLRREYITPALAWICRQWFGFPDGTPLDQLKPGQKDDGLIKWGGWRWDEDFQKHPHCPGSFTMPSRYCFYPEPGETITRFGQAQGKSLTSAATTFFSQLRGTGKEPAAPIAKGLFNLTTNDGDVARNVIGFMVGFLAPAEGNLRFALYDWIEEKTLWRVQRALTLLQQADLATDPTLADDLLAFKRADTALLRPLMQAMQRRPGPDLLWRLAVADDRETGARMGDLVIAGLSSAKAQDAGKNEVNVDPVFGGVRAEGGPVHACPAYKFSMGTMLGMLSALLECGRIETLPAPLIVRLTDLARQASASPVRQSAAAPEPAK